MPSGADGERPDVALHALVDVERLAVGADLDAVGRAHLRRRRSVTLPSRSMLPDLAGALAPVRDRWRRACRRGRWPGRWAGSSCRRGRRR